MKFLFLLILISFSSLSFASSWPTQMYTIERLFSEQFSGLRTYIKNLKVNYPYKVFKNKIVFYKDDGQYHEELLTLYVKRQINTNKIKEEIIFSTHLNAVESFVFVRVGQNLTATDTLKLTSFNINFPNNVENFYIEFEEQKIYQSVQFYKDEKKSNYRLYDYGLEIHHIEKHDHNQLYSKLWYQCDVCSGEPLVVKIDQSRYSNASYFYGSPLMLVTPKEFYTRASRSYLSGIYREFRSIPEIGKKEFFWPKD